MTDNSMIEQGKGMMVRLEELQVVLSGARKKEAACWEWIGAKDRDGYGRINVGPDKRSYQAHRLAWELTYGPIPEGVFVCHHCDSPGCVNPNHLFLGSNSDNIQDALKKGRKWKFPDRSGENHPRAKLTWDNVQYIRENQGVITQREMAQTFGVSISTIAMVVTNRNWRVK